MIQCIVVLTICGGSTILSVFYLIKAGTMDPGILEKNVTDT